MIKSVSTHIFITLSVVVMSLTAVHAQEAKSPVAAPEDLMQAFQKEYVYLASQKQALSTLQSKSVDSLKKQSQAFKAKTMSLQSEVVALSSKNDERHEYLMSLEKRKKELEKKGSSLENSYKKAHALIQEMQLGLKFSVQKEKESTSVVPEDLKISSFDGLVSQAQGLIAASSTTESFQGAFLNQEDKLVEGTITRFGRSAAIGTVDDQHFVLAPNGNGLLKALAMAESPSSAFAHLFIFDNLLKEAQVKHKASFIEKIADFSPLIFLGMILLLVGGLFTALIKV